MPPLVELMHRGTESGEFMQLGGEVVERCGLELNEHASSIWDS